MIVLLYAMATTLSPHCFNYIFFFILALRVPFQVTGLLLSKAVRSGRSALRVAWTTPYSDASITQYQVQYRRSGTAVWSSLVYSSSTSTHIEALAAGTTYQVRVRAVSSIGNGPWSAVDSERTYQSEFQ